MQSESPEKQSFTTDIHQHRLRPGDVLYVDYVSKFPKFTDLNVDIGISAPQGQRYLGIEAQQPLLQGYVIRPDGTAEFPYIKDPMPLAGLTVEEANFLLQKEVLKSFDDMMVRVTLLNFYVTILGEITRPGRYPIYDRQINLFEVFSLAGEPTLAANRKKVRLMRQEADGQTKTYLIDMTKEGFVSSEQFYLRSGDTIYLEPLPGVKSIQSNGSAISVIATIVNSLVLISNVIFTFSRF
ncbi:MAG: polysaccharide biosynthesis/export family protein [Bernardetiaceae bacterium]